MKLGPLWLLAVAPIFATTALAQVADIGLRAGLATPGGNMTSDWAMAEFATAAWPLQVDGLYRWTPNWRAGAWLSWAPANQPPDALSESSLSILRYGLQAQYHFQPDETWDPWMGAGLGRVSMLVSSGGYTDEINGLQLLDLQAGMAWQATPTIRVGPVFGMAVERLGTLVIDRPERIDAAMSSLAVGLGGQPYTGSIGAEHDLTAPSFHVWLNVGVAGTFSL